MTTEEIAEEINQVAKELDKKTKAELVEAAEKRNVPTDGNKAELVARLAQDIVTEALAGETPPPEDGDKAAKPPAPKPAKAKPALRFKTTRPGVWFRDVSQGIEFSNTPAEVQNPRRSAHLLAAIKSGAVVEVKADGTA